jgi:hypothetical protein
MTRRKDDSQNVPVQWMRRRKELEAVSGVLPIANDCSEMCRQLRDENNDLKAVLSELCRSSGTSSWPSSRAPASTSSARAEP